MQDRRRCYLCATACDFSVGNTVGVTERAIPIQAESQLIYVFLNNQCLLQVESAEGNSL